MERTPPRRRKPLLKRVILAFLIASMNLNTGCFLGGLLAGIGRAVVGLAGMAVRGVAALGRAAVGFIANGGGQQIASAMNGISRSIPQSSAPPRQTSPPVQPVSTSATPAPVLSNGAKLVPNSNPPIYRDAAGNTYDATGKLTASGTPNTKPYVGAAQTSNNGQTPAGTSTLIAGASQANGGGLVVGTQVQ